MLARRSACMAKALSVDLRDRVVAAVEGGLSRRKAAERFGVSISSAIRWTELVRATGAVRPRPVGGDKRSGRIEACAPGILHAVEAKPALPLVELRRFWPREGWLSRCRACGASSPDGRSQ